MQQQEQMSEPECNPQKETGHREAYAFCHLDSRQEKQYPTCGSCHTNGLQLVNHISMVTVG